MGEFKLEAYIPIITDNNMASMPVGVFKQDEKGRMVFKFNDKAKIKVSDINHRKVILTPSYIISKDEKGFVKEIELVNMSLNHI